MIWYENPSYSLTGVACNFLYNEREKIYGSFARVVGKEEMRKMN
jgi:hypothetical protein